MPGLLLVTSLVGCSATPNTSSLALGGYRSVRLEAIKISDPNLPFDTEKFAKSLEEQIQSQLKDDYTWADTGTPTALLHVEVVRYHEQSGMARQVIGLPHTLEYVMRVYDLESRALIGQTQGIVRLGPAASIITSGSSAIMANQEYKQAFSDADEDQMMIQKFSREVVETLRRAKRIAAPLPAQSVTPPQLVSK
jgi:hypothetical protein